jgi:DNA-3-methyladenine glycosylase
VRVARELLGATVTVRRGPALRSMRLVETEAYVGNDGANHASAGPTARNLAMFGPPGTLYVYRIHQVVCANLVTRPGEAVLLRAGELAGAGRREASGPGRLCRALGLTIADNGADAVDGRTVEVRRGPARAGRIVRGPRVGIRRSAARPLRFALAGEPAVSSPRPAGWSGPVSGASPRSSRDAAATRRSRTTRRRPSGGGRRGGRTAGK